MTETLTSILKSMEVADLRLLPTSRLDVVTARNKLASKMIDAAKSLPRSSDVLCLWIDSDAFWRPETLARMRTTMNLRPDIAALSACASVRIPNRPPMAWTCLSDARTVLSEEDVASGEVFRVEGTAFHFILHRFEVLERLGPDPFNVIDPLCGEDLSFCSRLKSAGLSLAVDASALVGHVDADGLCYYPYREAGRIIDGRFDETPGVYRRYEYRTFGVKAIDDAIAFNRAVEAANAARGAVLPPLRFLGNKS